MQQTPKVVLYSGCSVRLQTLDHIYIYDIMLQAPLFTILLVGNMLKYVCGVEKRKKWKYNTM